MNRSRFAAVGAIAAVLAMFTARWVGAHSASPDSAAYWGGVALGGALLGLAVSSLVKPVR
jgi:hypothetical protein